MVLLVAWSLDWLISLCNICISNCNIVCQLVSTIGSDFKPTENYLTAYKLTEVLLTVCWWFQLLSSEERLVGFNSLIVRSVGEILAHGLRESKYGYWHIVRDLTHPSTRQCIARALKHVTDNNRRGEFHTPSTADNNWTSICWKSVLVHCWVYFRSAKCLQHMPS